jgi:hypothetical protein
MYRTVVTICTAQWSLYVPHSGHCVTFSNSTFCPHSVFMCFVWIWEQTAIISLYSINWLVFITETESVYCAVRTGYLYIIHVNCHPWPRPLVPGFSSQKLGFDRISIHVVFVLNTVTLGHGFLPVLLCYTVSTIPPTLHSPLSVSSHQRSALPCKYHPTNAPLSPVSTVPPTLHSPLSVPSHQRSTLPCQYLLLLPEGQMGEACETSTNQCSFGNREALDKKVFSLLCHS